MSEDQKVSLLADHIRTNNEPFGVVVMFVLMIFLPLLLARWVYPSIQFKRAEYSTFKNVIFSTLISFCILRAVFALNVVWLVASYPDLTDIDFWSVFGDALLTWDKGMLLTIIMTLVFAFAGARNAHLEEPWLNDKSNHKAGR